SRHPRDHDERAPPRRWSLGAPLAHSRGGLLALRDRERCAGRGRDGCQRLGSRRHPPPHRRSRWRVRTSTRDTVVRRRRDCAGDQADTMIRVLLADDEAMIRSALAALLRLEGDIDVVAECADGEEALAAATRLVPDVCLLDIEMPGLDGVEVA